MLRAVSSICLEGRALELIAVTRRDALAGFRRSLHSTSPAPAQTVLSSEAERARAGAGEGGERAREEPPPPPPPPPPRAPRRAWPAAALAVALTSLGGVYFYRKMSDESGPTLTLVNSDVSAGAGAAEAGAGAGGEGGSDAEAPYPALGEQFPAHVNFLVAGAGTAAFAAMRAIRSARPDGSVLLVGEERALPYMRPPLSKELWREPDLAARASQPDHLTFRQWNGKRRPVVYEPAVFYTPVEALAEAGGGAGVARGWRVARIDVERHAAELRAPGRAPVTVTYDKCLVATGVRARRIPALREAAARGRSLALRSLGDAARLAAALDRPDCTTVAIVGGGFLATELAAALADRLSGTGKRVVQVISEAAPMGGVLPAYLAQDAARRLQAAGVTLLTNEEVVSASCEGAGGVRLALASGAGVTAGVVVEAVGSELDPALATASRLELHPTLGGLLVNAELQARADVWAAGDAACFYDVVLGRRRVEHHDHAVLSGRLAGHNMAAPAPQHYTHQSMFWSDLGPQLGYEAIGIIDSRLPTVGIFSADAVQPAAHQRVRADTQTEAGVGSEAVIETTAGAGVGRATGAGAGAGAGAEAEAGEAGQQEYSRGVVFYLRDQRVVGVLLWNLFNRMHVARQVVAQGEFEDLLEVGKLFAPHEED